MKRAEKILVLVCLLLLCALLAYRFGYPMLSGTMALGRCEQDLEQNCAATAEASTKAKVKCLAEHLPKLDPACRQLLDEKYPKSVASVLKKQKHAAAKKSEPPPAAPAPPPAKSPQDVCGAYWVPKCSAIFAFTKKMDCHTSQPNFPQYSDACLAYMHEMTLWDTCAQENLSTVCPKVPYVQLVQCASKNAAKFPPKCADWVKVAKRVAAEERQRGKP